MYDRIMVPTDGSDHAERAAHHAVALARAFDAELEALSVLDLQRNGGAFSAGGVSEAFYDRLESEAEDAVGAVAGLAENVAVETTVVEGRTEEVILEHAEETGVDLVAMGTGGRRGLRRFVTGDVTEYVVRTSPVPVLTAHATDDPPVTEYDDVLVPTDGSEAAATAIEHALAVAGAFDATVHALNVVDLAVVASGSDAMPDTGLVERLNERGESDTEAVADRVVEGDAGVDVVTEVREGSPANEILEYVEAAGIDLVAMGTRGRSGLDRLLLGSTTERVIRRCPVPVLATRPTGSST